MPTVSDDYVDSPRNIVPAQSGDQGSHSGDEVVDIIGEEVGETSREYPGDDPPKVDLTLEDD